MRAALQTWRQHTQSAHEGVTDLVAEIDSSLASLAAPVKVPDGVGAEVNAALDISRQALDDLRSKLDRLAADFSNRLAVGGDIAAPLAALAAKLAEYDKAYAAVKDRSSAHEAKLKELAKLETDRQTAVDLSQRQRKERDALGEPAEQHKKLRDQLTEARTERTDALAAQCAGLSSSSGGMIRASLSANRGFDAAQEKFKALIAGSNVRGNKIADLFDQLAKETNPAATWEAVLDELESLMLLEADAEVKSEQTPTLSRLGLAVADQTRLAPKLTPDGWLDLSLTELADFPEFEYQAKENDYIPFDSASAGQQASALLGRLLSQGGTPLIIDQPEDDLDSATVQQVVAKIWASKSGRQLIFSSHNANLVVNGDADLVLVCDYVNQGDQSAGHIKEQGAIDVEAVRHEITSVMESGEKAFRLRKEKYGF